ncbi:MAG TPA: alkaline phosphatase family protein [Planctomycetota bacterium]
MATDAERKIKGRGAASLAGALAGLWWWLVIYLQVAFHNQIAFESGFWLWLFVPGAVLFGLVGAGVGLAAGLALGRLRSARARVAIAFALPFLFLWGAFLSRLIYLSSRRAGLMGADTLNAVVGATVFLLLAVLLGRLLPRRVLGAPLAAVLVLVGAALLTPDPDRSVARVPEAELTAALESGLRSEPRKLILFCVDGLDWNVLRTLVQRGELPAFERAIGEGVSADLATFRPTLSPLIWNTMATGWSWRGHGVSDFVMTLLPRTPRPVALSATFLDRVWTWSVRALGREPVRFLMSSYQRRRRAFWELFGEAGAPTAVTNWWATHPVTPFAGSMASDQALGDRAERLLREEGLAVLSGMVHPGGEGVPGDLEPMLAQILGPAAAAARETRARAFYAGLAPEAGPAVEQILPYVRTGMRSQAFLEAIAAQDGARVYVHYTRLVDATQHLFWQFWETDSELFADRPPPPQIVARYADMIPIAHRVVDAELAALRAAVGQDATVVILSDHGFHATLRKGKWSFESGELPVSGHHQGPPGVFLGLGPGFRVDESVAELSVFDVLPTLAGYLGLPVAENLPGSFRPEPFTPEFLAGLALRTIASYEIEGGAERRIEALRRMGAEETVDLTQLGYIDD